MNKDGKSDPYHVEVCGLKIYTKGIIKYFRYMSISYSKLLENRVTMAQLSILVSMLITWSYTCAVITLHRAMHIHWHVNTHKWVLIELISSLIIPSQFQFCSMGKQNVNTGGGWVKDEAASLYILWQVSVNLKLFHNEKLFKNIMFDALFIVW